MRRSPRRVGEITIPDRPRPERVPPIAARVILGGRSAIIWIFCRAFSEEALRSRSIGRATHPLGGFNGAEALCRALLGPAGTRGRRN